MLTRQCGQSSPLVEGATGQSGLGLPDHSGDCSGQTGIGISAAAGQPVGTGEVGHGTVLALQPVRGQCLLAALDQFSALLGRRHVERGRPLGLLVGGVDQSPADRLALLALTLLLGTLGLVLSLHSPRWQPTKHQAKHHHQRQATDFAGLTHPEPVFNVLHCLPPAIDDRAYSAASPKHT